MTSTFSTVINFGMLGLLRRLHRLQIQANLQAESNETGIIFPQPNKHCCKGGQGSYQRYCLETITNECISEAVKKAQISAKEFIESLGMLILLQKKKIFDDISFPREGDMFHECDDEEEDEEEDEQENESEKNAVIESQIQEVCVEYPGEKLEH